MKDVAISSGSGNDSKKFQRGAANNNRIQAQTSGNKKRIESLQRLAGVHEYHSNRYLGQPPPTPADRGLSESLWSILAEGLDGIEAGSTARSVTSSLAADTISAPAVPGGAQEVWELNVPESMRSPCLAPTSSLGRGPPPLPR
jgi:hypothetical protein